MAVSTERLEPLQDEVVDDPPFEIRRRALLYLVVGLAALAVGAGFGFLAWERDDTALWVPGGVLLFLALTVLQGVRDARTPLFVADAHGVRMRDGDGWVGLLWSEMADIRVEPRDGLLDPRVKVISPDGRRIHTAPLGLGTTVSVEEAREEIARRRGGAY
ncbi:MAG: hypothetical protein NTV28_12205 [Propionibacteriales bacterium]|nr:hypothetical protein [Propionibacteriales bacterium]